MEEIIKFKPFNVILEYNPHKSLIQSIEEYLEYSTAYVLDKEKCIEKDTIYAIQVYPETTIGFYFVCASDYKLARDTMIGILEKNKPLN